MFDLNQRNIIKNLSSSNQYEIVDRIGGGAYGSVYKARGLLFSGSQETTTSSSSMGNHDLPVSPRGMKNDYFYALKFVDISDHISLEKTMNVSDPILSCSKEFDKIVAELKLTQTAQIGGHVPQIHEHFYIYKECTKNESIIQVLHERGIVHRDIKCDNLIIDDSCGRVVLCDFGVSWSSSMSGEVEMTSFIGSPFWIAPEVVNIRFRGKTQIGSTQYDSKIDIWSLGMVIIEMWNRSFPSFEETRHLSAMEHANFIGRGVDFEVICHSINHGECHVPSIDLICFLSNCFHVDPRERWNAKQLLTRTNFMLLNRIDRSNCSVDERDVVVNRASIETSMSYLKEVLVTVGL